MIDTKMPLTKSAERIQLLLSQKGWNESELARFSGVSQPTVHRYASGETETPKKDNLKKIAKAFNVSYQYISGEGDDQVRYGHPSQDTTLEHKALTPNADKLIARIRLLDEENQLKLEDYKLLNLIIDRFMK